MNSSQQAAADEVFALLKQSAGGVYFGEEVTQLEHALQCAAMAKQAGADEEALLYAGLYLCRKNLSVLMPALSAAEGYSTEFLAQAVFGYSVAYSLG